MAKTKKGTLSNENRFWFAKSELKDLPRLLVETTKGTPFEGSRLRFTGNRSSNKRFEFELVATVDIYQIIPGYKLVGYARTEDGKNFHVHRLADFEWSKDLVDELDPLRCDVCNQRRLRKRQFIVKKEDTGELLIVGGSCARKFCDIDLEKLIRKFFRAAIEIFDGMREELDKVCVFRDTCFEVALVEEIIRRKGYVSQKKAEIENTYGTVAYLVDYFHRINGELSPGAEEIHALVEPSIKSIRKRAKEFEETHFQELVDHFEDKLKNKWSEFDHNCVAWLKGASFSRGLAAYFGSIKPTLEGNVPNVNVKRREVVKGFDGAKEGVCSDLGKFLVVNTKWKSGHYGESLGFTCVSEDGGKLWFQMTAGCKSERDWSAAVGDAWVRESAGIEIEIRGTVSAIQQDISFAKRIKIKKIFENGAEMNG